MTYIATITSKKQLTIPAKLFKKQKFAIGQKVVVSEVGNGIVITPAKALVDELAGSLKVPPNWKNKDVVAIISEAKHRYFSKRTP